MVMVMVVGLILEDFSFNWGRDLMGVIPCIRLFDIEGPDRIGRRRQIYQYVPNPTGWADPLWRVV